MPKLAMNAAFTAGICAQLLAELWLYMYKNDVPAVLQLGIYPGFAKRKANISAIRTHGCKLLAHKRIYEVNSRLRGKTAQYIGTQRWIKADTMLNKPYSPYLKLNQPFMPILTLSRYGTTHHMA